MTRPDVRFAIMFILEANVKISCKAWSRWVQLANVVPLEQSEAYTPASFKMISRDAQPKIIPALVNTCTQLRIKINQRFQRRWRTEADAMA